MKLVIERNKLLPALSAVMGAVARKSTLPILTCLHVVSDGEVLTITASNLEMTLRVNIPDVVCTPFEALWPGRRMMEIVKSYPEDGIIGIAQDEPGKMVVKCGRSRFSLATLDPQDYPVIENAEFENQFTIDQELLRTCLNKSDFAMATQDVRYYLNGLLFHGFNTQLDFVATDGHRLACSKVFSMNFEINNDWQGIVPSEAIGEIKKACSEGECIISVSSNMMRFDFANREIIVKLIDGRFPDYPRVIPKEFLHNVTVDRTAFVDALQRIRLVIDAGMGAELNFTNGLLKLGGGIAEERADDQIDADYQDDDLTIGLNVDYLLDVLRVIESSDVKMLFNGADGAVKIIDLDCPDNDFIIMTMRI